MTREKFIKLMKEEVENFSRHWVIMQDINGSRDWPEELPSLADWFEQFDMWFESWDDE